MTVLNRREYKKFIKRVEEDLKNFTGLVPTPKIEKARQMVLEKIKGVSVGCVGKSPKLLR